MLACAQRISGGFVLKGDSMYQLSGVLWSVIGRAVALPVSHGRLISSTQAARPMLSQKDWDETRCVAVLWFYSSSRLLQMLTLLWSRIKQVQNDIWKFDWIMPKENLLHSRHSRYCTVSFVYLLYSIMLQCGRMTLREIPSTWGQLKRKTTCCHYACNTTSSAVL